MLEVQLAVLRRRVQRLEVPRPLVRVTLGANHISVSCIAVDRAIRRGRCLYVLAVHAPRQAQSALRHHESVSRQHAHFRWDYGRGPACRIEQLRARGGEEDLRCAHRSSRVRNPARAWGGRVARKSRGNEERLREADQECSERGA